MRVIQRIPHESCMARNMHERVPPLPRPDSLQTNKSPLKSQLVRGLLLSFKSFYYIPERFLWNALFYLATTLVPGFPYVQNMSVRVD